MKKTFEKIIKIGSLYFVLGMLSACIAHPEPDNVKSLTEASTATLPATVDVPYTLQIGDMIDVKFLLNPEMDEELVVRPDGRISTAVAQDIVAYGKTPQELQKNLADFYKKHLHNPQPAVIVRSYAPARIYVIGEVTQPGEFISIDPNITLLQAIARAGGLKNSADMEKIVVIRRQDGKDPQVIGASYAKAASGEDLTQDVRLANRDVVFVNRHGAAEAYLNYEQYFKQFIAPSMGMNYQLNSGGN